MQYDGLTDDALKERIGRRIADSDVLIALTHPVATRRAMIQWEIKYAQSLGIPVLGVARRYNDRVSSFVRRHADELVLSWRIDQITDAIRRLAPSPRQRPEPSLADLPPVGPPEPDMPLLAEELGTLADEPPVRPAPGPSPREVIRPQTGSDATRRTDPPSKPRHWWWPFARQ
jgi:hypothetical protein